MSRNHGRHRAPRRIELRTKVARTAIMGAVVGVPLVVAVPAAHAASDGTWERVADCESGGRWAIDTGNGYHGGLQFSPSTWTGFGGGEFAPVAYQATRAEQIVVAERVLAKQGWGAWPVCSRKAGAAGEAATQRSAPAQQQAPAAPARKVRLSAPGAGDYVVVRGDTLSEIASAHNVAGGWQALVQKNPSLAGHPDRIMPGEHLKV